MSEVNHQEPVNAATDSTRRELGVLEQACRVAFAANEAARLGCFLTPYWVWGGPTGVT